MKPFHIILYVAFVAVAFAQPGYKYQQPPAQQPISSGPGPSAPAPPVFAAVRSPPLPQYSAPPAPAPIQSLPAPIQSVPAPQPAPQQTYLAPQPQPQQTYLPPQSHPQIGQQQLSLPISAPQVIGGAAQLSLPIGGGVQQSFQQQSFQQPAFQQQSFQQPAFQQQSFQQPAFQSFSRPQTAIITKDIYIHSAPEDQEENALGQQLDNAPIRKNYRIVFIKAPTQNLKIAAAALKHAQTANEEKTVIYVLSKKPDLSEVHQQLQQAQGQQKAHKPEVYFIKYKTQEEAQRAQQEIQAQYDALGGSTHISDEGVAPVASVIGSAGGSLNLGGSFGGGAIQQQSFAQQNYQTQSTGNFVDTPSTKYLPVKKKRAARSGSESSN